MGAHGVTCHPAEVMFPPLPQPKHVSIRGVTELCQWKLTVVYNRIYDSDDCVTHHRIIAHVTSAFMHSACERCISTLSTNRMSHWCIAAVGVFAHKSVEHSTLVDTRIQVDVL